MRSEVRKGNTCENLRSSPIKMKDKMKYLKEMAGSRKRRNPSELLNPKQLREAHT